MLRWWEKLVKSLFTDFTIKLLKAQNTFVVFNSTEKKREKSYEF